MKRIKKVIKVGGYILTLSILILFFIGLFNTALFKETISETMANWGLFAVAFYTFILELIPQSISAHLIILLTGLLKINSPLSMIIILVSAAISSIFGFWLGRKIEKGFFEDLVGKKTFSKVKRAMTRYGSGYVLVSAISPLPYIPILFGAFNMKWRNFLIWGLIPRLVGFLITILFAGQIINFINSYFPSWW